MVIHLTNKFKFTNLNQIYQEQTRGQIKTKDEMKKDFIGLIKQALTK